MMKSIQCELMINLRTMIMWKDVRNSISLAFIALESYLQNILNGGLFIYFISHITQNRIEANFFESTW